MSTTRTQNPSDEHNQAWPRADLAAKSALARAVDRSLRPNLSNEARNAATRAIFEIGKMIAHVRRCVAAAIASSRHMQGWTWHLLHVLDWDSIDVDALEGKGTNIDHRTIDREWNAAERRLRSAVAAYRQALPDLLWSAQCFDGAPLTAFPTDVDSLYVVRCNLAHGFKTPDGPRDRDVLAAAAPVLGKIVAALRESWRDD